MQCSQPFHTTNVNNILYKFFLHFLINTIILIFLQKFRDEEKSADPTLFLDTPLVISFSCRNNSAEYKVGFYKHKNGFFVFIYFNFVETFNPGIYIVRAFLIKPNRVFDCTYFIMSIIALHSDNLTHEFCQLVGNFIIF